MDNKKFYFEAVEHGVAAEGRIAGALRGGRVYKGLFAANGPSGSFHVQSVETTQELKVL
jgi:hypothetical protein